MPWGIEMVSNDLVSHSNQYPSEAPKEILVIAEVQATTTALKKIQTTKKVITPDSLPSTPLTSINPQVPLESDTDFISRVEDEVLRLTNQKRSEAGLSTLEPDTQLRDIAWAHSADMLANDYFSHENHAGCNSSCRTTKAGYAWRSIGENIYMMSGYTITPEQTAHMVVEGWMNSPGHRANMLGSFTVSGVGVVRAGESIYATTLYAKPR